MQAAYTPKKKNTEKHSGSDSVFLCSRLGPFCWRELWVLCERGSQELGFGAREESRGIGRYYFVAIGRSRRSWIVCATRAAKSKDPEQCRRRISEGLDVHRASACTFRVGILRGYWVGGGIGRVSAVWGWIGGDGWVLDFSTKRPFSV